jgi:hypothetical protein
MIFLIIVLLVVLLVGIIFEGINYFEFGTLTVSDKDLSEALGTNPELVEGPTSWRSDGRSDSGVDKDSIKLKLITGKSYRFIKTEYSLLFPYYDFDLGVVPVWYRSADVIKKVHEAKMRETGIKQTSREKLGF